ncbi:MAG: hypothetical protein V2A79_05640, partial [Planctomycetota bacterium]
MGFGGGGPSLGNYVGMSGDTMPLLGGRTGGSRTSFPPAGGGGYFVSNPWQNRFAWSFTSPEETGAHLFTVVRESMPVQYSMKNEPLFHRMILTYQLGNSAPTRNTQGVRIRDALSRQSLENAPAPETLLDRTAPHRTYSQVLAARMAAEHARAMAEGWERFHDGQYREAVECFAAAEVANPADPQAAIGTVFAAVADRSGA